MRNRFAFEKLKFKLYDVVKKISAFATALWFTMSFKQKNAYCLKPETVEVYEMSSNGNPVKPFKRPVGADIIFIFDLDETLCHPRFQLVDKEMIEYEKLYNEKISDAVRKTRMSFSEECENYVTFREVFESVGINLKEYWDIALNFPFEKVVTKDERLMNLFEQLSKFNIVICCFTNSCPERAKIVLERLGILKHFHVIIGLAKYDKNFVFKPDTAAYTYVSDVLGITNPKNAYFFENTEEMVANGRNQGWNVYEVSEGADVYSRIVEAAENIGFGKLNDLGNSDVVVEKKDDRFFDFLLQNF